MFSKDLLHVSKKNAQVSEDLLSVI